MLLEFRAKNYKSFKDEFVFKMIPAPKIHGLDFSVLKENVGKKSYKALSSAVIYGPNASGKTNIVGAMDTLRSIVLKGDINNKENTDSPDFAADNLELIPNIQNTKCEPLSFYIKFITEGILFEYSLDINVGTFLELDYDREIVSEKLCVNEKMIFNRDKNLNIDNIKTIENYLVNKFNAKASADYAKNNLNKKELFLTAMFKTIYSADIANLIIKWFREKNHIVYRANTLRSSPVITDKKGIFLNSTISKAAKMFGIGGKDIGYIVSEKKGRTIPMSLIDIKDDKGKAIPADVFESLGTLRFINLLPILLGAIKNGETVIIDEFDASIHPMALMSIINIFHDNDINKNGAQLIFNTHNPIFLNKNLFRRDEIKFVEMDESGLSTHYSLSDFGTSGGSKARNNSDYMKNYFIKQYGAINNIDFSDVFIDYFNDNQSEE